MRNAAALILPARHPTRTTNQQANERLYLEYAVKRTILLEKSMPFGYKEGSLTGRNPPLLKQERMMHQVHSTRSLRTLAICSIGAVMVAAVLSSEPFVRAAYQ